MAETLRHLRFPGDRSRGRRFPEPAHPYRSDFQRDRDRIVHARAFRRLEDKTQVWGAGFSDHFRNRLTHTIEVAQLARTVASVLELDEELTEALALAHDIGHPPFAHSGEEELDHQMQRFGGRFDHNLQALRIVESFEQSYARFPGLNLTFEVREGIAKHSRDFAPGEIPELDQYLPGLKPPLEAQLIDLADEIAYNTADLDDAYEASMFGMEEIASAVPGYAAIVDELEGHFPGASEKVLFHEVLRRLIDTLISGLIEGTRSAAIESGAESVEDLRRLPARLARMTPGSRITNVQLKEFLRNRVYCSPLLAEERASSTGMIGELFGFFLEHPEQVPPKSWDPPGDEPLYRQVCDYIAGMTDGFLRRTHAELLASR
ncbi:MAG: dNTP triphosphohydrolase [Bryobacterales bacterium]|nr:dNTP triphosphohydrolase [Bryobacterales bacterium]